MRLETRVDALIDRAVVELAVEGRGERQYGVGHAVLVVSRVVAQRLVQTLADVLELLVVEYYLKQTSFLLFVLDRFILNFNKVGIFFLPDFVLRSVEDTRTNEVEHAGL